MKKKHFGIGIALLALSGVSTKGLRGENLAEKGQVPGFGMLCVAPKGDSGPTGHLSGAPSPFFVEAEKNPGTSAWTPDPNRPNVQIQYVVYTYLKSRSSDWGTRIPYLKDKTTIAGGGRIYRRERDIDPQTGKPHSVRWINWVPSKDRHKRGGWGSAEPGGPSGLRTVTPHQCPDVSMTIDVSCDPESGSITTTIPRGQNGADLLGGTSTKVEIEGVGGAVIGASLRVKSEFMNSGEVTLRVEYEARELRPAGKRK